MIKMTVLSFGEILLRLQSSGYSRLFQNNYFETSFCGSEANVSVSLSLLGLHSQFLTIVPDNPIGIAALNSLRYFGVDISKSAFKGNRLGLYYYEKGASQRSSSIIYDRKNSSFANSSIADYDWNVFLNGVNWFHFSGINPALSKDLFLSCLSGVSEAKRRGIIVSCDLNYRYSLWSPKAAQKAITKLMPFVNVCIANEEDVYKSLGYSLSKGNIESGKLKVSDYKRIAKQISLKFGCTYIAFTLRQSFSASYNGWFGMLYNSKTNKYYISKKYNILLVDRVGGGDSFSAGLIFSLSNHYDDQKAIDFAIAASCLKQTMDGDFNRATHSEIENLMNSNGSGRIQR